MVFEEIRFLIFADYGFVIFHSGLILFNLLGWYWRATRVWHLWTISLTFASWIVLGIWYGWGYCPLTDWHWQVLEERGVSGLPNSYISYLIQRVTGLGLPGNWVDTMTLILAFCALVMSLKVNFFSAKKQT
ncbi:DUF2784 domain-containing protein [Echinicola jeungdonensis]|uniref:DUF2784 domain-containing protein n=1 Tax=Echinicola jeungdonensis TaxID=709343 RepID=A0ABV5J6G6_9BACT|nr:DUF2784 domain-containing protein [Echinicola jeungdonensis]MDN3669798.1 DUF2784 domain-containing protein [Echinicola jeungdonensis]